MPAGHGLRSRARDSFSHAIRKKGVIPLSTYLRIIKVGDYVDVEVNDAVHKGMMSPSLMLDKILRKRIHVRIEHVQLSRCSEEVKERVKKNDQLKAKAKARGEIISTKRQPQGPKPGFMVEGATLETVTLPYHMMWSTI